MNKRDQLAQWTTIVADSGDLEAIRTLKPHDATTNPSLLLAAARSPASRELLEEARRLAKQMAGGSDHRGWMIDAFATLCGQEMLQHIPGVVSTEVDARLSFDTRASVEKARRLIALYRELGIDRDRVLIKIAATWEGIRAAEVLEAEGIRCNITLLFCLEQAVAAAEAGATLISPFVGRILDWHLRQGEQVDDAESDPGVLSVRRIYQELKARDMETVVMGASFRNRGQIEALAGCDRLTISPALLQELEQDSAELERKLAPGELIDAPPLSAMTESEFRLAMNQNRMAGELLADGIRRFIDDQVALEGLLPGAS